MIHDKRFKDLKSHFAEATNAEMPHASSSFFKRKNCS